MFNIFKTKDERLFQNLKSKLIQVDSTLQRMRLTY
jgi:hypothetical protein